MHTLSFDVRGMTCGGGIQRTFSELRGFSDAAVTLSPGMARLTADSVHVTTTQIDSVLASIGHTAKLRQATRRREARS